MPIYEYICQQCEHQFDALQKMSDEPLKDCPACQAPALTKLVSAPSFRLSGSGWYETDFKSDRDKKKNLTEDSQKNTAEKGGDSENKSKSGSADESKSGKSTDKPGKGSKKTSSGDKTAA